MTLLLGIRIVKEGIISLSELTDVTDSPPLLRLFLKEETVMSIFKRTPKPTATDKLKAMGTLVVAAYAIQVGVSILDAALKGAGNGIAKIGGNAKQALAARKAAAMVAAETQAEVAEETAPAVSLSAEASVAPAQS